MTASRAWRTRLTGVGTPWRAAARRTAPFSASYSRRRPRSRSWSMEVLSGASSAALWRRDSSTRAASRGTPLARATATTSSMASRTRARPSSSASSSPTVRRVTAVAALKAAFHASLSHSMTAMLREARWSMRAPANSASSRATRALGAPSSSPKMIRPPESRWTTPGATSSAPMCVRPASNGGRSSTAARRASFSMPFCNERTIVSGPTTGRSAAAAASVSYDFTHTSTTLHGPASAGVSTTRTGAMRSTPRADSMRTPSCRSAARFAPRATNTTSTPACARRPPKKAPSAPVPMTSTRSFVVRPSSFIPPQCYSRRSRPQR